MKKEIAIQQLELRKEDLNDENFDPVVWKNRTIELLKKIFIISIDDKITSISQISFTTISNDHIYQLDILNKGKERAKKYIIDYILEIEIHGIEKTTSNRVDYFKYWGVWSLIVGAAFSLGLYFGLAKFDKDKSDYYDKSKSFEKKNIDLEKTLDLKNKQVLFLKDSILEKQKELDKLYLYIGSKK